MWLATSMPYVTSLSALQEMCIQCMYWTFQNLCNVFDKKSHFKYAISFNIKNLKFKTNKRYISVYFTAMKGLLSSKIWHLFFRPEIKVGYSDKMIEVHSMTMEASENAGGVVRAVVNLVGRELGLKTICLDSVATPM